MNSLFGFINALFASVVPVADFLWDFPTNYAWYASIPIVGKFSVAFILLLGGGIYFTIGLRFVQITQFKNSYRQLMSRQRSGIGTSALSAFLLSLGMRVGAGNIVGVTGAVTLGGPGAIFWMWLAAFLGMSTAFGEATLAQIYKEQKGNEYVGGFTFYIQKIWGDKRFIGVGMCVIYLIYNMLSIPVHTFHVFTAASSIVKEFSSKALSTTGIEYYSIALFIVISLAVITFGGVRRVTHVTDKVVPVMAMLYVLVVLALILMNLNKVPLFFFAVFKGAFSPDAIFGGAFGIALSQGLKRGLLSNEAGMGTVTQASSIADANHPCEQGFVQALGVFFDTIIICSLTGFILTAGQLWTTDSNWSNLKVDKIATYLTSIKELVPGTALDSTIVVFASVAFGLFAFTTLLGDLVFTEIAANKISQKESFMKAMRSIGALIFVPLGVLTVLAGLQLDNLWYVSDLINVVLILINIPTMIVGRKTIIKAYDNYLNSDGSRFLSSDIGIETEVWNGKKN